MARGRKRREIISAAPSEPSSSVPKKLKKSAPKIDDLTSAGDPVREMISAASSEPSAPEIDDVSFAGDPVPSEEAKSRWPHRYQTKDKNAVKVQVTLTDGKIEEKQIFQARCHYTKAIVDGVEFNLFDDAYIVAPDDEPNYIGKIVEMFETRSKESYICTQWFYRAKDTVIKDHNELIDAKRVFYSEIRDDNPLSSIHSKITINVLPRDMDDAEKDKVKGTSDLYVDMLYSFPHAFTTLSRDKGNSTLKDGLIQTQLSDNAKPQVDFQQSNRTMLDLYAGCGAMSSGLSIGASLGGVKIVTKWAVDFNYSACQSLKYNHPKTEVRNEDAENFYRLLLEWEKLCDEFIIVGSKEGEMDQDDGDSDESEIEEVVLVPSEEFEVERLISICYGDPNKLENPGLHFKVRWKGYGPDDDTWEPAKELSKCKEKIKDFVVQGHRDRLLPLPGDVDFLCGGPPCQGISGHNRFRKKEEPLDDKKNYQLVIYMNIVEFLKPRYVLMENVIDMLKYKKGTMASLAVARLVSMDYQTRLGIMAAGAYGVPQCRMRFFLWGAAPTEILPQFPLPTHEVLKKGVVTNEFKELIVGHGDEHCKLDKPVLLGDLLSDLPEVTNDAVKDELDYASAPKTSFQKYIRLKRHEIFGYKDKEKNASSRSRLYDHRPLRMNKDDLERVCRIPHEKGANFRSLPGLLIGQNKVVKLDLSVERPLCKSGNLLVPNYALSFEDGKSFKPFGRLWYDDIVPTVVTRAEPHNQIILHPNQNRVLSVRENARLQGFPDCYKLYGSVKDRYTQVGNAVSFAVSIPLGFCLAKALQGVQNDTPLKVPYKFPDCLGEVKNVEQDG